MTASATDDLFKRHGLFREQMWERLNRATQQNMRGDPRLDYLVEQLSYRLSALIHASAVASAGDASRVLDSIMDIPAEFVTFITARDTQQDSGFSGSYTPPSTRRA